MLLKWLGHSCFAITAADGTVLLTDPFDESVGYAVPECAADIVTESHQHHDHNDISHLKKADRVLSAPGQWRIGPFAIATVSTFHDDQHGAKRGGNLIFVIKADGLTIVHMGDLGHMLEEEQISAVRGADVMLLPVGGFYTIDAETAERVRLAAKPRVTIPMHFLTPAMHFPIRSEEPFLALNGGVYAREKELRIDPETISRLPQVLVLDY